MIPGTLAAITAESNNVEYVVLGEKLRGPDRGRLVLPGGKDEWGTFRQSDSPAAPLWMEHPYHAVVREVHEETGINLAEPRLLKAGATAHLGALTVRFQTVAGPDPDEMDFHVAMFRSRLGMVTGLPPLTASDELIPGWYDVHHLPIDRLQPDVRLWLPHFLSMPGHPSTCNGSVTYIRPEFDAPYELADYSLFLFNAVENSMVNRLHGQPDIVTVNGYW